MATQQEGCHICKQNKPAQHDDYCNARANERTVLGSHPLEPGYEGLMLVAHNRDDEAKNNPWLTSNHTKHIKPSYAKAKCKCNNIHSI